MVLSTSKLLRLLEKINEKFPRLQRISAYALPKNLNNKTEQELKSIVDAGLKLIYVGVESGDDELLKLVNKGETFNSTADGLLLAKKAGLRIGLTGSIAVDRTMQTSDKAIFACGDCAEKISFFGGRPSPLKLASIATFEARIVGANLFSIRRENVGTVGVWSTAVGEVALATAGLTEAMAREHGYDVVATTIEGPNRHPGAMPGATNTKAKLVFERNSGVILGGQIMGDAAAGEIINAISACVQSRMTAEDIATFQVGTHPALTASPIAYHMVNAAEMAIKQMHKQGA